ncbi:hypothetical protein ABLG96_00895 [Nakamurella sp. A5-74]|uniref:Uncharacterized protein n=1 Tax=Nakamurella sp. A5-74 TaxID=3158264 RepID=A0AAU8DSW5_9ACTN
MTTNATPGTAAAAGEAQGHEPTSSHRGLARPAVELIRVRALLGELGQPWTRLYEERLSRYRWRRYWPIAVGLLDVVAVIAVAVAFAGFVPRIDAAVVAVIVVTGMHFAILGLTKATLSIALGNGPVMDALGAGARCLSGIEHRLIAEHRSGGPVLPVDLQIPVRSCARAAQKLYSRRSGGPWTPHHAPALDDRALLPAYALMSVYLPESATTHERQVQLISSWRAYVTDAVGLMAVGRADLLVALRTKIYGALPDRSGEALHGSLQPDKDEVRFVSPLRDRHRWDFGKDFVLPALLAVFTVVAFFRGLGA